MNLNLALRETLGHTHFSIHANIKVVLVFYKYCVFEHMLTEMFYWTQVVCILGHKI